MMADANSNPTPSDTRIDAAHAGPPPAAPVPAAIPVAAEHGLQRAAPSDSGGIVGHAAQLAERLGEQRRELDRRAELLATQEADLAEKVRAAEEWLEGERERLEERETQTEQPATADPTRLQDLEDRDKELDSREAHLNRTAESLASQKAQVAERIERVDARQAELAEQEQRLEQASKALVEEARQIKQSTADIEARRAQLDSAVGAAEAAQDDIAQRERRLELRAQEIQTAVERYHRLGVSEERVAELQAKAAESVQRDRRLAEAEALLADERAALSEAQMHFAHREADQAESLKLDRQSLESDRAAWRAEAKSVGESHDRREALLDRREESIQRMQREVETAQREVLEMRLATEETWAELTGVLAPAALSKSIAKVRARLADHYRHTLEEIADSRGELRDASRQVVEDLQRLEQRQIAIEEWANRRHEELGEAASRHEAREQELSRQQREFELREARWATERTDYREQIRALLAELRRDDESTSNAA